MDLISRQATINTDGLDEEIRCEMCRNPMHTNKGCDGNCKYDEKLYEKIIQILDERIKPLPPAQPESHWISCEERLPEVDELVLVTDDSGGVKTVDVDRCGEYEASSKRFWYYTQNVVAWMPLPEPYKEDE